MEDKRATRRNRLSRYHFSTNKQPLPAFERSCGAPLFKHRRQAKRHAREGCRETCGQVTSMTFRRLAAGPIGRNKRRRAKPNSPYARRLMEVKIRERRADSLGAMVLRTRAHRRRIRRAPYDGHLCPGAFQEHPWPARFRSQKSAELLG